jgi:hypothetical protein
MKALLIRVAADQSEGGGHWNGPVDSSTGQFAYVAIPEERQIREGHAKPYSLAIPALAKFEKKLPDELASRNMHLDPDFDHLTYGDQGTRAQQIRSKLGSDDLLVFYSGLKDVRPASQLVYALIGLFVIEEILLAKDVPGNRWHENAHTRRHLSSEANDIVVRARYDVSGRLKRCIPIGDYRQRAYRVWPNLSEEWGGLNVKDGYLQRSARLPEFLDAARFYAWFINQSVPLISNNY